MIVLITGASGTLGYAFARLCRHRNLAHVALTREELDISDPASVEAALKQHDPWAIINCAGYQSIDAAQNDEDRCYRENTAGPALLATTCERQGIGFLTFSSDQVFNGRQMRPYVESDPRTPMSVYGRSKARAEQAVLDILPAALVVRTGTIFGPWDAGNFVATALRTIAEGRVFEAIDDVIVSPAYAPDLVHACLDLLIDGESGIWHLTNKGGVTWKEFAEIAAVRAGLNDCLIQGCPVRSLRYEAPRPRYSVLSSERAAIMQTLDAAIGCYLRDCGITWTDTSTAVEHKARPGARMVSQRAGKRMENAVSIRRSAFKLR